MRVAKIHQLARTSLVVFVADGTFVATVLELPSADDDGGDAGDDDTHCCTKCHLVFTSLDAYVQHKLSKDACRPLPAGRGRSTLPRFSAKSRKALARKKQHAAPKPRAGSTFDWVFQGFFGASCWLGCHP